MTTRRSLLGAMLAACAAPAYVKAGILMPVRQIVVPDPFGQRGYVSWPWYQDRIVMNEDWMEPGKLWGHSHVNTPEHRAAQQAANRHLRLMMDNAAIAHHPLSEMERHHENRRWQGHIQHRTGGVC